MLNKCWKYASPPLFASLPVEAQNAGAFFTPRDWESWFDSVVKLTLCCILIWFGRRSHSTLSSGPAVERVCSSIGQKIGGKLTKLSCLRAITTEQQQLCAVLGFLFALAFLQILNNPIPTFRSLDNFLNLSAFVRDHKQLL